MPGTVRTLFAEQRVEGGAVQPAAGQDDGSDAGRVSDVVERVGVEEDEVDRVVEVLPGIVERLRAMSPLYKPTG